jgi:hypothetical protein
MNSKTDKAKGCFGERGFNRKHAITANLCVFSGKSGNVPKNGFGSEVPYRQRPAGTMKISFAQLVNQVSSP